LVRAGFFIGATTVRSAIFPQRHIGLFLIKTTRYGLLCLFSTIGSGENFLAEVKCEAKSGAHFKGLIAAKQHRAQH
jgi:hypothetical protein